MRTAFRPKVEGLEAYRLLAVVMPSPNGPAQSAPTATLTLTTDKTSYSAGDPVHMTLTETNNTTQRITFTDGPSADGFYVTQNGATVWRSNAGFQPMFLRLVTLQPGQSLTFSATWDGHSNDAVGNDGPIVTDTFQVHSQVKSGGAKAPPVTITVQPANNASTRTTPVVTTPTTPPVATRTPVFRPITPVARPVPSGPSGSFYGFRPSQWAYRTDLIIGPFGF
jgi:hypothetical protein